MVQAKISTMKAIGKEYEKHCHNLTLVGEEKQINYLIGNKFFSKIDLSKVYWQVPMTEEAKKYTALITHDGLYQFL